MNDVPTPRILLPSLLAGPTVVLLLLVAGYMERIPQPLTLNWSEAASLLVILPVSVLVGFLPAVICCGVGTLLMLQLGYYFPLLRFPLVWAVAGGLAAWVVVRDGGAVPYFQFAMIGAGASTALLCRMRLA